MYRIILENIRYRSIEFQLQRKFQLLQYLWFMKKKEQLLQISILSMYVYILCFYISFNSLLLKILIKINIDLLTLFNIMYHLFDSLIPFLLYQNIHYICEIYILLNIMYVKKDQINNLYLIFGYIFTSNFFIV